MQYAQHIVRKHSDRLLRHHYFTGRILNLELQDISLGGGSLGVQPRVDTGLIAMPVAVYIQGIRHCLRQSGFKFVLQLSAFAAALVTESTIRGMYWTFEPAVMQAEQRQLTARFRFVDGQRLSVITTGAILKDRTTARCWTGVDSRMGRKNPHDQRQEHQTDRPVNFRKSVHMSHIGKMPEFLKCQTSLNLSN